MAENSPGLKVGFVGIGNMGKPMAGHLVAAGHDVAIYDTDRAKADDFVTAHGGGVAGSLAELATRSDVVVLMLPDGKIVRKVVMGAGEGADCLLKGLAPGKAIIDMSSSAPVGTRELGAELAPKGIALLDAPVSGGVKGAVNGTLAIMVGGEKEVADRLDPVLAAMGRRFYVGSLGAGHAAKVLNNYVSAAGLAAAAEALEIAQRFGIDGGVLVDVLNASTGRNNSTENKFKQYVLNRAFNSGFALDLMVKDLRLAMEVAEACDVPAVFGHQCLAIWQEAQGWTGANADHTEFARFILDAAAPAERKPRAAGG